MVHDSQHVVVGQGLVAHDDGGWLGGPGVKVTSLVVPRPPGFSAGVGVLLLADDTEQADIAVGERLDGATTATGAWAQSNNRNEKVAESNKIRIPPHLRGFGAQLVICCGESSTRG